jgi:hypothetical protein
LSQDGNGDDFPVIFPLHPVISPLYRRTRRTTVEVSETDEENPDKRKVVIRDIGRFILWIRPLHFPHLFLRLRFGTANNRYWLGYLGQHMPSSEHLGAGEHQM